MPFLTNAGVNLRYERVGTGPAVLLIHGWAANHTFWDRQLQGLRAKYTLIAPDLRGHGESSRPKSGYGVGALAGDLETLVRALRVPRVAVVGWSMGGLVAMELVRRLGERASALGLVCTVPGRVTNPELAETMVAGVERDFRGYVREFAPQLFKVGKASPLLAWATGQLEKTPPHVASACIASLRTIDLVPQLAALRVRTTVFHGRHDALLPPADAETLTRQIPGAELIVFEESGHMPPLEEPDGFNAALDRFLGGQSQSLAAAPAPAVRPARGGSRKAPAARTPRKR